MRRPPRPCKKPACPGVTQDPSGYCEKHQPYGAELKRQRVTRYEAHRPNRIKRGHDAHWYKFRKVYLHRNPLCAMCAKDSWTREAVHIHHIKALADGGEKYDEANLMPVCHSCHSKITLAENNKKR